MAKVVIIFDSQTGNTEKLAKAIAEGAGKVDGVRVIIKKLGEPFSTNLLNDADGIVFGSPAHYGYVSKEMRDFIEIIQNLKYEGRIKLEGKLGVSFGAYGWDGGTSIERLAIQMEKIGIKVIKVLQVPILPNSSLNNKILERCREVGKNLAIKISRKK